MISIHWSHRRITGIAMAVLLSSMVVCWFYGPVLRAPDHHMFNTAGDGLKNYFSFAWHVRHDTSAFVFNGMNQPFGEHIDMPDAQPWISNTWRAAVHTAPALDHHTVGLINLLMLASSVICALFLSLILMELSVAPLFAGICAAGIAALSPQLMRMPMAHYALAYSWAIPLMWWALLRATSGKHLWRAVLVVGFVTFLLLGIHVYLGFMVGAFAVLWALFGLRSQDGLRRQRYRVIATVLLCMLLFRGLQWFTDTHVMRTQHPGGFFDYRASMLSILVPDPSWAAWPMSLLGDLFNAPMEGRVYLGLASILGLLVTVVWGVIALVRRMRRLPKPVMSSERWPHELRPIGWAAFVLLLFSFGLPYGLDPFEGLLWHSPIINQFRAPGRFAWVFYYVFAVWVVRAVWLWRAHATGSVSRPLSILVVALVPISLFVEGARLNGHVARQILSEPNLFDRRQLSPQLSALLKEVERHPARALITLPYFHNGAEELMIEMDEAGLRTGQVIAYHTGIPLMNASMTRTGLDEVRWAIQATGPAWYERSFPDQFRSGDTLLVIKSGSAPGKYDDAIAHRAHPIGVFGGNELSWIRVNELLADRHSEVFEHFAQQRDSLALNNGWYSSHPGDMVLYKDFEDMPSERAHTGRGAFSGIRYSHLILADLAPGVLDTATRYIASFWYYNRGPMQCHAMAGIDDHDTVTNTGRWVDVTDPRFCRTIVGDWSLVELPFTVLRSTDRVKIFLTGARYYKQPVWIDDLMVRKADGDVYRVMRGTPELPEQLFYNGHWLDR